MDILRDNQALKIKYWPSFSQVMPMMTIDLPDLYDWKVIQFLSPIYIYILRYI